MTKQPFKQDYNQNIRYKNIENLVGNYAKSTLIRDMKTNIKSHTKNHKLYMKPSLEARLDRSYRTNINDYNKALKDQTDQIYN